MSKGIYIKYSANKFKQTLKISKKMEQTMKINEKTEQSRLAGKKIGKILFFALVTMVTLQSCDKDDCDRRDCDRYDNDHITNNVPGNVSEQAKLALSAKYPNATRVEWGLKNNYRVANFNSDSVGVSAWFDNSGAWYMTETDIRFKDLPQAVKTSFTTGKYASWAVDDVDKVERNATETVYVIEAENQQTEVDLYYSAEGTLVKELSGVDPGYDYEDYIPSAQPVAIESYIKTNYPNARILEVDKEGAYTDVEILDGQTKRDLIFDNNNKWISTKTELRIADVPTAVVEVFKASEYASYRIDDVDHYQTPTSEYYRFDLKAATGDVKVDITTAGVLTVADNTSEDRPIGGVNQSVNEFIAQKYIGAKIIESEYKAGYLEVDIYHQGKEKTVCFNASNKWIDTQWDIRQNELPQAVTAAISISHASYKIDDLEYYETPNGDYYTVELERGNSEIILRIKADGTII